MTVNDNEFGKISRRTFLASAAGLAAGLALAYPDVSLAAPPLQQPDLFQTANGTWVCACGKIFANTDELEAHIVTSHTRNMPRIVTVDKPTYEQFIVGKIEKFDQKAAIFARSVWDQDYIARMKATTLRPLGDPWKEASAQALMTASSYVDAIGGNFDPRYGGRTGHMQNMPGLWSWDAPVSATKMEVKDPAAMSAQIKELAKYFGATLVGITKLDQRWVYSNYYDRENKAEGPLQVSYTNAIVMAVEMPWKTIDTSPELWAAAASALGYTQMLQVAAPLADYIRLLGYTAVPSGNDSTQNIPQAIDAGLGELGRCGLLVTPQIGPRLRLCKVLTDLPLVPDKPIDFGLQRWCPICGLCAQRCPAQAIKYGERTTELACSSNRPGLLRWPVNVEKCFLFWQTNRGPCAVCIATCPWGWPVRRWLGD